MQVPVPFNLEAEVQILGALMARNRIYHDLAADVSADDFYDDGHAEIFRTISALVDTGKRVTATLVLDYLGSAQVNTHVDAAYINQIMDAVPAKAKSDRLSCRANHTGVLHVLVSAYSLKEVTGQSAARASACRSHPPS